MFASDLIDAIERLAPPGLAEPWDNVGLLLGDRRAGLTGPTLLTIDLNEAVMAEAERLRASAVVAYHPPIFQAQKRITADSVQGAVLLRAMRAGMVVYSPHTALDAAVGGMTDWLADAVLPEDAGAGSGDRRALLQRGVADPRQSHKIVTYVPAVDVERVRNAMASAGAGLIGAYDLCSFTVAGVGTFRGGEGSAPTVGQPGRIEAVDEVRLEMVALGDAVPLIIDTIRAFHPYEEPAIDVYRLEPKPQRGAGAGRRILLDRPAALDEIARRVEHRLGVRVRVATPRAAREEINGVGVCPGAGAALLDAAIDSGCTAFLTGEMKHHEVLAALDRGCAVVLAGHTATERGYLPVFAERLRGLLPHADIRVSVADTDPLRYI